MKRENFKPKSEQEGPQFVADSIGKLDDQRLEELKKFQGMQSIKDEVLKKEKTRLEKKLGTKHPRVQTIESKLSFNKGMFAGLEKEIDKASIKQEPFDSTSWRVNGRVFDSDKKPVKSVTVYLSDTNKNWIKELGSACTDEKGYYSITLNQEEVKQFEKQPLYLTLSDKNKKTIYSDKNPLTAKAGLIDVKDIYLKGEDCTPPHSE